MKLASILLATLFTGGMPAGISWLGITLGQPASELRASLGDPLRVTQIPEDADATPKPGTRPQRKALYTAAGGAANLIVTEIDGRIYDIEAVAASGTVAPIAMQPDPLGNVLGATFENVLKAHPDFGLADGTDEDLLLSDFSAGPGAGIAVFYRFKTKVLQSMTWTDVIARRGPALPPIAEARGVTADTAIVDGETSDRAAVGWEYTYLRLHPCAANDAWKVAKQSTLTDPKPIDRLHVTCAATGEERDFYFDISRSYGKF